jgi:nucleoside-diphosphate-sugar epimerase
MRIAILGATSQIAKDLIDLLCKNGSYELYLYARKPSAINISLKNDPYSNIRHIGDYDSFGLNREFDGLINFVGVGNPAMVAQMGADIFDLTFKFDQLALNYLHVYPKCRYIFLSSGAAYGSDFRLPAQQETVAKIPINGLTYHDWYGVAKLHAECRHRSYKDLSIIDFRIFNYFSSSQDIDARFLISDIIRAIRDKKIFRTTSANVVRDYLHPSDLFNLLLLVLTAEQKNDVVDCYSRAPVDKLTLLKYMKDKFEFNFEFTEQDSSINSTGEKANYYSLNNKAKKFGYLPTLSSLEGIARESEIILKRYACK